MVGVSYDVQVLGRELCFIRHGKRACVTPTHGWVTLDVRKGDGSGGKQYLTLRNDGVVYARKIVQLAAA